MESLLATKNAFGCLAWGQGVVNIVGRNEPTYCLLTIVPLRPELDQKMDSPSRAIFQIVGGWGGGGKYKAYKVYSVCLVSGFGESAVNFITSSNFPVFINPVSSQLLFFNFSTTLLPEPTNQEMGSHASDENIYLLGRDEAETERYVFLLDVLYSLH